VKIKWCGDCWWIFTNSHIGKNESLQRCVGEGINPKYVVFRQQNKPKTMLSIFFKQNGHSKVHYFEQWVTIDKKTFKSSFFFPIISAQNKQL